MIKASKLRYIFVDKMKGKKCGNFWIWHYLDSGSAQFPPFNLHWSLFCSASKYSYNLLVQCPTTRTCKLMTSACSGAELMVKGCHSNFAMAGILTNTQSPGAKLKLCGLLTIKFVTIKCKQKIMFKFSQQHKNFKIRNLTWIFC